MKERVYKKVLFLHGWWSQGWAKRLRISSFNELKVVCPLKLSDFWLPKAIRQAQAVYDAEKPDLVVGSSRGGGIALRMNTGNTPLLLMAPAWHPFFPLKPIEKPVVIVHGRNDVCISDGSIRRLCQICHNHRLIVVNEDHRLNGKEGKNALQEGIEFLLDLKLTVPFWELKSTVLENGTIVTGFQNQDGEFQSCSGLLEFSDDYICLN